MKNQRILRARNFRHFRTCVFVACAVVASCTGGDEAIPAGRRSRRGGRNSPEHAGLAPHPSGSIQRATHMVLLRHGVAARRWLAETWLRVTDPTSPAYRDFLTQDEVCILEDTKHARPNACCGYT